MFDNMVFSALERLSMAILLTTSGVICAPLVFWNWGFFYGVDFGNVIWKLPLFLIGCLLSLWLRGLIATLIGFLFWEWYFIEIFETQQSQMRFFLIHGRHLSGRVQCRHRAMTAMWTTMSSGNPIYHERHLSGHVQCSHWAMAVSNIVTGPLPTISIMRPDNPIYELLYEFKLHCHLLGNLSHHFDNCFRSRETVNIKYYINNSGLWIPTRHLPILLF